MQRVSRKPMIKIGMAFVNNVGKYTLKSLVPHNSGSMNVLSTAAF
jgi:hypothetical protein